MHNFEYLKSQKVANQNLVALGLDRCQDQDKL